MTDTPTETMRGIRERQHLDWGGLHQLDPSHKPDTLLIGCIDARLNPAYDIGIPHGNALIRRTIAALIPPHTDGVNDASAMLDYAIGKKGIKHIAIMGHTLCGGLEACRCGDDRALPAVHQHLDSIHPLSAALNPSDPPE